MSRVLDELRLFADVWDTGSRAGVVAVSGGADSVAMLRGLVDVGVRSLTVAHFNHRLRGEESTTDAEFVRELAASLGLVFRLGSADVAEEAAGAGDNLEATARRLRYDWLTATAIEIGAEWVATGHTADDQAETVLHRLTRGTGVRGLRGVIDGRFLGVVPSPGGGRPVPLRLRRPLLAVTRSEVVAYLASLGQSYREDTSNADPRFTRNRLRHELLPLLKTFNPDVVPALGRLAGQAADATRFIEGEAIKLLVSAERERAGAIVVLDPNRFADADPFLTTEVLRTVWEREKWPLGPMTQQHWLEAAAVTLVGAPPAADFPGGVWVRRKGRVVQLGRRT